MAGSIVYFREFHIFFTILKRQDHGPNKSNGQKKLNVSQQTFLKKTIITPLKHFMTKEKLDTRINENIQRSKKDLGEGSARRKSCDGDSTLWNFVRQIVITCENMSASTPLPSFIRGGMTSVDFSCSFFILLLLPTTSSRLSKVLSASEVTKKRYLNYRTFPDFIYTIFQNI